MARALSAALLLALMATITPSSADDLTAEAAARFQEGRELYDRREYVKAALAFEAAFRLVP